MNVLLKREPLGTRPEVNNMLYQRVREFNMKNESVLWLQPNEESTFFSDKARLYLKAVYC